MSDLGETCRGCNSDVAGIVFDHVARTTSCSDCGLSIVTTEPKNSSSDDCSAATKRKFDELLSSDHGNSQNLGSNLVSIAVMSDRLGLPATIKDRATEIYKTVENTSKEKDPNASRAASIYMACRLEEMTHSMKEISSIVNGVTVSSISYAIALITEKQEIRKHWFMDIKAADFISRFCSTLKIDGQAVRAAQEAAQSSECVNRGCSPISVAAALVYVIAQLSPEKKHEKKLLEDVLEATGVVRITITKTYKVLYPHLPTIIPKWFAKDNDLEALVSP